LTADNPLSIDGSINLEADINMLTATESHSESLEIDLSRVSKTTAAIIFFLDGGIKNFQLTRRIRFYFVQKSIQYDLNDPSGIKSEMSSRIGNRNSVDLFQTEENVPDNCQSIVAFIMYRKGKHSNKLDIWKVHYIYQSMNVSGSRLQDMLFDLVITYVPKLHKYLQYLFPNVQSVCNSLSSTSLPKLKEFFMERNGLQQKDFCRVIFNQLYQCFPTVLDDNQAAYTIAVLNEMFQQIDFNGDGTVDWVS
jgi:hypothetical protein